MHQRFFSPFVLLVACAGPSNTCATHTAELYKDARKPMTQAERDSLARLGLHDKQPAAVAWIAFEPVDSITIKFSARCPGLPDNAGGPEQEGTIALSSLSAGRQPRVAYRLRAHSFDGWLDGGEDMAREEDGQYVFGAPPLFREIVLSKDRTVLGVRTSFCPCYLDFWRHQGVWHQGVRWRSMGTWDDRGTVAKLQGCASSGVQDHSERDLRGAAMVPNP